MVTESNTASLPGAAGRGRAARLADDVRARISRGALAPGARLPSVRRTAAALRLSPSTVVEAYERLVGEGEIVARPGSGFYVAARPRPLSLQAAPAVERDVDPSWVIRQSLETRPGLLRPGCGWLPETWMPADALRRALRAEARGAPADLVDYGTPLGFEPLRGLLARRLAERDIPAHPAGIVLTDSGTQAIDLVCRLLLRPGDAVLVDDPCYYNLLALVRAHRARPVGVPYTSSGPDLAALERALLEHRPRLYLTVAGLHNPTGATPAPAVQHRLLRLADAHDVIVIEDDIFADLEPEPTPRLAALDGLERVILVGSTSKTLSAGMRCGFVVARPDWIEALVDLKLAATLGNAALSARVAYRLLADGSYRRHVEGVRRRLARARAETAARLRRAGLSLFVEPRGGLFLWAELPGGLDGEAVSRRALREAVVLAPGKVFSVTGAAGRFLRFNAAQCAQPRIFEVLAAAMRAGP